MSQEITTFPEFLKRVNWKQLREQKAGLLTASFEDAEHGDGLVHLIDAIQDLAVASKLTTEEEVFGRAATKTIIFEVHITGTDGEVAAISELVAAQIERDGVAKCHCYYEYGSDPNAVD